MLPVGILNKAIECAMSSQYQPFKVGAVVFKQKRILSFGFNSVRTCSRVNDKYKEFTESLHAELDAITKIQNKNLLKGASIIVVRITPAGNLAMSYPCKYCLETIKHFKIKKIFYSSKTGEILLDTV